MARPLRLEHAGAIWHITSRGNEKQEIFRDDSDREWFLAGLARTVEVCGWRLHAYVLMGNHFHLLLETPEPTLSRGMHQLNGFYTQKFNWRHARVGHLFQGRFKSILVERESHLLELVRYVVLNPVRAGLVPDVRHWRWSNYLATAGLSPSPAWLEIKWTLGQFGAGPAARNRYRRFVSEGRDSGYSPWKHLTGQVFLGSAVFRQRIQTMVNELPRSSEIPREQLRPIRASLPVIIKAAAREFEQDPAEVSVRGGTPFRLAVVLLARTKSLIKLAEVAACFGTGISTISSLASRAERTQLKDPSFRARVHRIEDAIRKMKT